jgi:hypothetical protein
VVGFVVLSLAPDPACNGVDPPSWRVFDLEKVGAAGCDVANIVFLIEAGSGCRVLCPPGLSSTTKPLHPAGILFVFEQFASQQLMLQILPLPHESSQPSAPPPF